MKITFLGTGTSQGIPIIGFEHPVCKSKDSKDKRMRVSVLVEWNDYNFVIDCGPDFRVQMINADVNKLDGVLFTHEHSDHTAGLDDIRGFSNKYGPLPIYAHERVIKNLTRRFYYIFDKQNNYPGAPRVQVNRITELPFTLGGKLITPICVAHGQLSIFGYRIGNFAYITDAKTIENKELKKLEHINTLVINALRIEPHNTHFNLEEALKFIEKVNPKRAFLTHISPLLGFHEQTEKLLPNYVKIAYDSLVIEC